ncbi:MAG TPA: hypothetical protein VGB79_03010 [Allosphingosinicella sp.]|jgi:hypothetical protein
MSLLAAAFALQLAVPAPAQAPAGSLSFDVQCMLLLGALAQNGPEDARTAMQAGSFYYLGRIDGRTPAVDLERAFTVEADVLERADTDRIVRSCGAFMEQRGQAVQDIGANIMAREERRRTQ